MLLGLATALIVVWAFADVGRRTVARWRMEHERPITLEILHWGDTAEAGVVQKLVERYEAEHPRVRIVRIHTPGGSGEMTNKLKTMLAAGTPPDLFYLPPDQLPVLAQMHLLQPIDQYLGRERKAGTGKWIDDFYPILMKAFRYDVADQEVGKGQLYGLPKDFTTAGFYINVDLFKKAGVKIPYDGWTWDQFEADMKKISALTGRPGMGDRRIYGGFFQIWPDTLRNILWTYGGDFFGRRPDGSVNFSDVTLDEPRAQEALRMIVRLQLKEHVCYNPTGIARDGGQEFLNGNIGCIGPIGRWMVPTYKHIKSFRWDFVPIPYKEKKYQASQIYYTAWAMSKACKHKDEAFKLMKFLCGPEGARLQSRLGLAIPPLKSVANSRDFLNPPGIPPHNSKLFLQAIDYARLQQIPPQPEWTRIVDDRIKESIQLGEETPMQNAKEIEAAWLAELNSPLRQHDWPPMRWDLVLTITIAATCTLIAILWWLAQRQKLSALDRAQARRDGCSFRPG